MGVAVTDDQIALAEAVSSFAEHVAPVGRSREIAEKQDESLERHLWDLMVAQGFATMHLSDDPEQAASLVDVAILLEQTGRHLVAGPLLPSVLTGLILTRCGSGAVRDTAVAALSEGARGATATASRGLSAVPLDDGWAIEGRTELVLGAPGADYLVLGAAAGPADVWFVVRAGDVVVRDVAGIDGTRRMGTVECSRTPVPRDQVLAVGTPTVRSLASTLFAAEAAGIARWCQETGLAYAKIRKQFGQPIGAFQAIKHKCARIFVSAELMSAAVWDAAIAFEQPDEQFALAARAAAVTCLSPAADLCLDTITLLGAIGNTWEHDVHLYWRRAIELASLLGRDDDHARELAGFARKTRRERVFDFGAEPAGYRMRIAAKLRRVLDGEPGRRQAALAEEGLVSPQYPLPFGLSAGAAEQIIIAQEFARAGLAQPSTLIGEWALPTIIVHGNDAQRERFVMPSLRGDIVWCQLFSEPEAGSDLASLRLRAEKADGGWVLNGQKVWNSNAHVSNWGICLARTDPAAPKHRGISYFLIDMSSPGLSVRPLREANGAYMFNETFFDDVFVPDDCLVGEVNQGWRLARTTLGNERLSIGSGLSDARERPADIASKFAASGPDVDRQLGQLSARLNTLDAMSARVVVRSLNGLEPAADGAILKLVSSQTAPQLGKFRLTCAGQAGAKADGAAMALLSAPQVLIGGGTVEMQLNMIGEKILGLPR